MRSFFLISFLLLPFCASSQVVLAADGPGDTYALINAVLAPNYNAIEVPDCNHTSFGNHIDEVFDADLDKNVFRFYIHVSPDNDRCIHFDRQRNEIKTYASSPDNLKAVVGETVVYKWKFKISSDFQPSSSFTHIHQIKSVGGSFASIPMISLTLRKSNPDRVELRYTATNDQNTLKTASLEAFRGKWITVQETIKFGDAGSYAIELKDIATQTVLLAYQDNVIDTWQDGAEFARPKWGIYRSLNNASDLKDETVLFADFSIEEISGSLSVEELKKKAAAMLIYPNPTSREVIIQNVDPLLFDSLELYDYSGRSLPLKDRLDGNRLNVSGLSNGLYFIVFKKGNLMVKVLKCFVK